MRPAGVGGDEHAGCCLRHILERERSRHSVIGEDALASTEQDRVDHQPIHVDEILAREISDKFGAAPHLKVTTGTGFEGSDGSADVVR